MSGINFTRNVLSINKSIWLKSRGIDRFNCITSCNIRREVYFIENSNSIMLYSIGYYFATGFHENSCKILRRPEYSPRSGNSDGLEW